ncbi:hypothetical protein [Streptomyces sp. V3I7]|uniref:hypothetical protein n=1 Tax=Streptomyces sp. V3I7 TaxID=3042278 RepID=UPI002783404F|nr:hypothetical protein [Streptomyces sp. V3I7]MDQ0990789.1 hypothetical protein [Streptomyces sp. V3I7]
MRTGERRSMPWWGILMLCSGGVLAVPAVLFVGLIALMGIGRALAPVPEPEGKPLVLRAGAIAGTWRDEDGGRLVFRADGTFVSKGVCGDFADDDLDEASAPDPGAGTWNSDSDTWPGEDSPMTSVHVTFRPSGVWTQYDARGTAARPVLWEYIGDPDNGELCVLRKDS